MGTNWKNSSLMLWLTAGLITLCSVGASNVPVLVDLLA